MIQEYRIDCKVNIIPLLIIFAATLASFYSREASAFENIMDPCSEVGLISLKGDVYHIARERRPENAWKLVQTLLCGKGEEATKLILDHIQAPNTPELQVIWPPESEIVDEYSVTIFRSKKNSLQDIENLLAKGEAIDADVYRVNFSQYDPHAMDHRSHNYIYTDAINLSSTYDSHYGRNHYLFFNDNRWVVASEASAFMADTHDDPCSESGLISLKDDVYQIARERRPENAWRLVQTLLCGKGEKATKFIFDHIQPQTSNNSIERPDDPYQEPDYPYMHTIWPPYSENIGHDVVSIYKSKSDNPQDFEDLLVKGEAYRAAVSPVNIGYKIDRMDKAYKNYIYRNYIYTDVISLYAETGRNNGIISSTYHLFFENDRWVIVAMDQVVG